MGNFFSPENLPQYFSKEELKKYCSTTCFSEIEIRTIYKKFSDMDIDTVNTVIGDSQSRIAFNKVVENVPELRGSLYANRICEVFCTAKYEHGISGGLNFSDFLRMVSTFSDRAPLYVKTHFAFRVFDFDNDGIISAGDIKQALEWSTGSTCLYKCQNLHLIFIISLYSKLYLLACCQCRLAILIVFSDSIGFDNATHCYNIICVGGLYKMLAA